MMGRVRCVLIACLLMWSVFLGRPAGGARRGARRGGRQDRRRPGVGVGAPGRAAPGAGRVFNYTKYSEQYFGVFDMKSLSGVL